MPLIQQPTLLHLDSSPRAGSISRELTGEFVKTWKATHMDGVVLYRDLAAQSPKPIDDRWIAAVYTPEPQRAPEQKAALALSDELIAELEHADEYVLGVAMHNFSIPSALKLWIDQIVRGGRTFAYDANGPRGLLQGKKATVLTASGGVYELGTPAGTLNFIEPYLKTILGFIGITDVKFVTAGGAAEIMRGAVDRNVFLQTALERVRAAAA
jgi:FMN-dependent NADH-azoreductase